MSNEIVPFMDETQISPDSAPTTQQTHSSYKRPQRSSISDYLAIYYFKDWGGPCNIEIEFNLISENHHLKHFFHPDKGHKYVNLFYPNPNNVRPILDTMKGPSVLYLRGCDQLFHYSNFSFEKFKTLTALEISNIGSLTTLPEEISEMIHLQVLNLSHLPIQCFPTDDFFSKLTNLQSLVLKACPNLQSLPKFPSLDLLASLDLSHLSNIEALPDEFFSDMKMLKRLILRGCSKLHCLPSMEPLESLDILDLSYTPLCRDTKGSLYDSLLNQTRFIKLLDLFGAQHVSRNFQFHRSTNLLRAVDLSRTSIQSVEFSSSLPYLFILLLRNCSSLVQLSGMKSLQILKVLDMSGCGSLSVLPEDLCELVSLKELILSGCHSLRELREGVFDKMSCLEKLDLSKTKLKHLPSSAAKLIHRGTHLILSPQLSSNIQNKNLVMNLETVEDDVASPCPESDDQVGNISISNPNEFHLVSTFTNIDSPFKRYKDNFTKVKHLILGIPKSYRGRMLADLEYILDNIDLLESFDDKNNVWKLLDYLIDVVDHVKADTFSLESKNLKDLIRLVVKLKLLVPRPKQKDSDPKKTWKKGDGTIPPYNTEKEETFLSSYNSLTKAQKSCLLCFALLPFPSNQAYVTITVRKRTLIHLWYGEGFIDDARQEQNVLPSSTATIEEIGQQILMVLQEKRFIQPSSSYFFLNREEHYWVKKKAKAEHFFDCMTPHLTNGSERACLLTSEYNSPSSCQIWLNQTKASDQNQDFFKNLHTLFNGNERFIDIKTEWFSKMRNLHVLHLGSWESEDDHIEVVDLKFLEELKNMKQLRLLHFEGVTGITKLPDSVCMLVHLKMLNLRECSQIEELPGGIGFLQNLSHLDVTHCPLVSMFPKGIKLLLNLEVLKGFLITYEVDGGQNKKACTLADLVELQKLRKLNLVVNLVKFPISEDLQVFNEMKNLCNLKITWLPSPYVDKIRRKASRHSRWQPLKCWEQQTSQSQKDEPEKPIIMTGSCCLEKLKKLVLCCFPSETAPDWLHPSQMQNLEKLYFLGGHLKTIPGNPIHNTWNVKSLWLKHTLNLDIGWETLRQIFPNMTLLIKLPQNHLTTFPVYGGSGLWQAKTEEDG